MLDLHCHILPGVDDGPDDLGTAVEMARCLVTAGVTAVAASPHLGAGPGGDVTPDEAARARVELAAALSREGISLDLLPNAEHHLTVELFERIASRAVITIGGATHWLLIELPWGGLARPEETLFRVRGKGYRLLLAHPERYDYLPLDQIERMAEQGVKMQVTLASFAGLLGDRVRERADAMLARGLVHVLASDLHRPREAARWLDVPLADLRSRCGAAAIAAATRGNPELILRDAPVDDVMPVRRGGG